jgi:hypothetical protein
MALNKIDEAMKQFTVLAAESKTTSAGKLQSSFLSSLDHQNP